VHNHPSGDPKPSRDDIEMTREIRKLREALGITIHESPGDRPQGPRELRSLGLLVIATPVIALLPRQECATNIPTLDDPQSSRVARNAQDSFASASTVERVRIHVESWWIRRVGSNVFLKWGPVEVHGVGDGRKDPLDGAGARENRSLPHG
jgi:hypothetical protein